MAYWAIADPFLVRGRRLDWRLLAAFVGMIHILSIRRARLRPAGWIHSIENTTVHDFLNRVRYDDHHDHSTAILTSERAQIEDLHVRELADDIIKVQRREIKELEWLIGDIMADETATGQEQADARPVPTFE